MARLVARYGGCGVTYAEQRVEPIVSATRDALANFDALADRAGKAASRWVSTMGAANTVREILAMAGRSDAALRTSRSPGRPR